ncbi:MAG: nucleotidyltransferase domain-containing protein [Lachnobacterium sp.]|nr:nucleotidyltransferase domain-containing protein [Lachnobacterium sp.]
MTSNWKEILSLRNITQFPLVSGVSDSRLSRVYPLMQLDVQNILEECAEYNVGVILFGSSITMLCNVTSDIDICIETEKYDLDLFYEVQRKIQLRSKHPCDVLYYNDLQESDKVLNEIRTKGLKLQEVKKCVC